MFFASNNFRFIEGRDKFISPIPPLDEKQIQAFKDLVVAFDNACNRLLERGNDEDVREYNILGHELDYFAKMYPTFSYEKVVDEKYFPYLCTFFTSYVKDKHGKLRATQKF